MPQNHENTKSHKKIFNPISSELEDSGKKIVHLGYLINFNVVNIGQGIKRFVK